MKRTMREAAFKETDPYAWIVLRLPKKLWVKAQLVLEKLKKDFRWNVMTGEMRFDNPSKAHLNSNLTKSNIVQIVHHALDSKTPEPAGYRTIYPFLVKGSTPPKYQKSSALERSSPLQKPKKKRSNLQTANFAKDKMLWEIDIASE